MVRSKVSVCIATFNQDTYIRDAVESVVSQQRDGISLQILIGDDGSTDGTPAVLEELKAKYPDLIQVVSHCPNVGAAANYRTLMSLASGDFVAHLDGDDFWMPGKLSAQLALLKQNPQCVAVYSNAVVVDQNGRMLGAFTTDHPIQFDASYLLEQANFLNHSSLLYRASALPVLRILPVPFIDLHLHLALSTLGALGYASGAHVVYRMHTANSMTITVPTHVRDMYAQAVAEGLPQLARRAQVRAVAAYAAVTIFGGLRSPSDTKVRERIGKLARAARLPALKLTALIAPRLAGLFVRACRLRIARWLSPDAYLTTFNPRR